MKKITFKFFIYITLITFVFQPFSNLALAGCPRFSSPPLYPSSCSNSCQNTCNSDCENTKDTLDLAPHCSAQKLDFTSLKFTRQIEWANTAAAVICGAACVFEIAAVFGPLANGICAAAGVAVMGVEISSMVQVSNAGGKELEFLTSNDNLAAFGGSIAGGYAGYAARGAEKAIKEAGEKAAKEALEKAAKEGAKEAAEKVAKEAAENSVRRRVASGACIGATLFAVAAGLSAKKGNDFKKAGAQECNYVIDHYNNSDTTGCSGNQSVSNLSGGNSSSGGATGASAQSGSTNSESSTQNQDDSSVDSQNLTPDLLNGALSASSEGPLGEMYKGINDPKAIDDILKSLGTDLQDLGKRLQKESPSQVINGVLPQLPQDFKSALTAVDEGIRDGKVTSDYLGSAAVSSSSGKKPKDKSSNPTDLWTFGKRELASSAGTTKEMKFGKPNLELDSKSTDIFHKDWKGSIFELISLKIQGVKNRLESMEWSLPLNRAFNGLSNRPKARPSLSPEKSKSSSLHPLILEDEEKKGVEQK